MALAVHLAWIPNIVWFMVSPPEQASAFLQIVPVTIPTTTEVPQSQGRAEVGHRLPEIQLPGMAPGGSSQAVAPRRHEWDRSASLQQQSWAPRALDQAEYPHAFQPHLAGRPHSPADRVSIRSPGSADIMLIGVRSLDDSLLHRRGDRLTGDREGEPGAGGTPAEGNRVPLGDNGELSVASAGDGEGVRPRASRRGARPRMARPAVTSAPAAADAPQSGALAGTRQSRQTAPEHALSAPVREPRLASQDGAESDVVAAGTVRRQNGQGSSTSAQGPGHNGQGRGTSGSGRSTSSIFGDYIRDVEARIHRHWIFPDELALDLRQGLVVLEIQIRHDGRIEEVTVRRSSGFEVFDAQAILAVHQANPLAAPPPEELFRRGGSSVVVPFSMRYRNPMFD